MGYQWVRKLSGCRRGREGEEGGRLVGLVGRASRLVLPKLSFSLLHTHIYTHAHVCVRACCSRTTDSGSPSVDDRRSSRVERRFFF